MANRRYIDFPIASSVGDSDIILIWQSGANKQTTKATFLSGLPENLDELNDVAISGLTNGQILRYDSVTGKWENTDQGNLDLNDLNDVSIVSPSNGQVLVYNSSTSKWENSSGGYVPYTGAVTTVNLGAQTIQAGSFVKAGGTAAQFLKANGSVDSNVYGTGTVTSVALTMPAAFSVANSPVTTSGTLAVTGAGNASQYIAGDGTLVSFPALTGYVPYTGANQTVNLNTQQLQAGHTTLTTNGSTETLTINHTSGSGKAINVTKGGAGEGLYVNKTSGSGNAATIVGTLEATTLVKTGGTSSQFLKADGSVDSTSYGTGTVTSVGLSSATSGVTIGSTPITTSGTITLAIATASGSQNGLLSSTDWTTFNGKQNALTNPVTGTGTTNYLPKFTGSTTIGNSQVFDNGTNVFINGSSGNGKLVVKQTSTFLYEGINSYASANDSFVGIGHTGSLSVINSSYNSTGVYAPLAFYTSDNEAMRIFSSRNVHIGPTPTSDNGARLQVSGTATFSSSVTATSYSISPLSGYNGQFDFTGGTRISQTTPSTETSDSMTFVINGGSTSTTGNAFIFKTQTGGLTPSTALIINKAGNVGIGTASPNLTAANRTVLDINGVSNSLLVFSSGGTYKSYIYNDGTNLTTQASVITFETNFTERMRITSGGDVLIGAQIIPGAGGATTGVSLGASGFITAQRNAATVGYFGRGTNDGELFAFYRGTTQVGNISVTGSSTSFNTSSDYRLKEDLQQVNGLEKINAINVYNYKWKTSNSRMDGVLAHELAEILPYAVFGNKDGEQMQSVDYSKIVPLLIQSIQELKQEIDTLKN